MDYTENQEPRLAFCIQRAKTFGNWLVGPTPHAVTCEEFLGSLEEAIAEEGVSVRPDPFALPEVAPDEFERIFQWFQS